MDDQNKNLILATALSFLVILVWFILFPPPEPAPIDAATETASTTGAPAVPAPATATGAPAEEAQPDALRVPVKTPKLAGSVSTFGGRIDDLKLVNYRETKDPASETVRLLSPVGQALSYYGVFGWVAAEGSAAGPVPDARTTWSAPRDATLTPETPVTLTWDNGQGVTFARTVAVDEDYMFTVTDTVTNASAGVFQAQPYAQIARHGLPVLQNIWVVHEGVVRRTDGTLEELDYSEMPEQEVDAREGVPASVIEGTTDGWVGFTDHYWMATLIPEQGKPWTSVVKYVPGQNIYQTEARQALVTVEPGATASVTTRLYAGAKEWETIRTYQNEAGIAGFLDSIDWGWFFFLTKPIFAVLHWLNAAFGNMGLAIIGLTFVLKLLVLPLAYKSYVSMARMKELQPEMEAIKERAGDDRQRMQKEMMELYRTRKVNPAAGCLPILIQIPIFFALYKVIFVTIELRHAPFFGWLQDLSAPDPSSLFNLFGALPWAAPAAGTILHLLFIGILPLLLGISMWLQQKLNPTPTDPTQAAIFAWMPWIFMFMLGSFASGLIVYWITNNIITFTQQYIIMKSHGHTPDLFGNIRSSFSRKPAAAAAAKPLAPQAKPKPATAPAKPSAPPAKAANTPAKPAAKAPRARKSTDKSSKT
jgi:YidC/Oxa1 family membrane protein insertase